MAKSDFLPKPHPSCFTRNPSVFNVTVLCPSFWSRAAWWWRPPELKWIPGARLPAAFPRHTAGSTGVRQVWRLAVCARVVGRVLVVSWLAAV